MTAALCRWLRGLLEPRTAKSLTMKQERNMSHEPSD